MAAVSDTSPLRYFVVIGLAELLPKVLGPIAIPEGVFAELSHPSAPALVRQWLAAKPEWLSVAAPGEPDQELSALLDRAATPCDQALVAPIAERLMRFLVALGHDVEIVVKAAS